MSHKSRHKRELYELSIAMWKKIYEAAKLCTRHSERPKRWRVGNALTNATTVDPRATHNKQ